MRPSIYCTLLISLISWSSFAQLPISKTSYSPEVEASILAVEEGISNFKFTIKDRRPQTIADRMAMHKVNGLTIAVIRDYKLEWAKGYGWADVDEKRPVTPETMFQPGSISKSLNAITILDMVEDRKLSLYTDINTQLKSWQFPYDSISKGKKITIADLLSHSAGLGVHGFLGYSIGDTYPTIPQILDGLNPANSEPVRSIFEPGKQMEYSGGGTMISELIAMDASGLTYDQLVQNRIFTLLKMTNSSFTQPPAAAFKNQLATGYRTSGEEVQGKYPVLIEQAAGGLWTTPSDLSKFIIEMQLSANGNSNKILSEKMTKTMLKPYQNKEVALGVFIEEANGHKYFSHSAGNLGFSGKYIASLEDGNGVVVFINSDGGGSIIEEVITSVANIYKWKGIAQTVSQQEITPVPVDQSVMNDLVGTYRDGNAVCTIHTETGKLWFKAGGQSWESFFTSQNEFLQRESQTIKQISRGEDGKVIGFSRMLNDKKLGFYQKIYPTVPALNLLQKYAGNYRDKDGGNWKLSTQGKDLILELFGSKSIIHFINDINFYLEEDFGVLYEFRLENGVVKDILAKSPRGENVVVRSDL